MLRAFRSVEGRHQHALILISSGGNGVRDRGSRLLFRAALSRSRVPADSQGCSTRRHSAWGPGTHLNAVVAWSRTKGNSYPSSSFAS